MKLVKETTKELNNLTEGFQLPVIAMLLEEYCKSRGLDMLEVLGHLHNVAIEVHKEFGPY